MEAEPGIGLKKKEKKRKEEPGTPREGYLKKMIRLSNEIA